MVALGSLGTELYFLNWLLAVAAGGCEARDVLPENKVLRVEKLSNDGSVAALSGTAPGVGVERNA